MLPVPIQGQRGAEPLIVFKPTQFILIENASKKQEKSPPYCICPDVETKIKLKRQNFMQQVSMDIWVKTKQKQSHLKMSPLLGTTNGYKNDTAHESHIWCLLTSLGAFPPPSGCLDGFQHLQWPKPEVHNGGAGQRVTLRVPHTFDTKISSSNQSTV